MNELTKQWVDALHDLSLRERILVQVVALSVILFLLDTLLISRHQSELADVEKEYNQTVDAQLELEQTLAIKQAELAKAKSLYNDDKEAIVSAETELRQKTALIENKLNRLVPPTQITELLRNLLSKTDGLKVLSINNEPVKDISLNVNDDNSDNNETLLYEHAATIKLSGSYQQLYDYLIAIENTGWELFWNTLHYKVIDYPRAEITLHVLTVSTDKHWIGL